MQQNTVYLQLSAAQHVSDGISPIIRSSWHCIYSIWPDGNCSSRPATFTTVSSNGLINARYSRYSVMSSWWLLKYVGHLTDLNKLYSVASCRIIITILYDARSIEHKIHSKIALALWKWLFAGWYWGRQQQTETQQLRERKREDNEKYDIIKKTAICFCLSRAPYIANKSHTLQCFSYAKCSKRRDREGWGAGDFRDMNTMPIAFVTRL